MTLSEVASALVSVGVDEVESELISISSRAWIKPMSSRFSFASSIHPSLDFFSDTDPIRQSDIVTAVSPLAENTD